MNNDKYITTDVLVIGGAKAGCFAAIKAAEAGVNVVVFEKTHIRRCGDTGTGLHHLLLIHPEYNFSFEEFARLNVEAAGGIADEDVSRALGQDSRERILELARYGVKIFQDDGSYLWKKKAGKGHKTKPDSSLMANICTPERGAWWNIQPVLAREVEKYHNVTVLNRTAGIGLLTRDGIPGGDVIGAIGLETRTGDFIICRAKAVIITAGGVHRLGRQKDSLYAPTRFISIGPPTNAGEGIAMAYRAGADIVNMEFPLVAYQWKDFTHAGIGPTVQSGRVIDGRGRVLHDAAKGALRPMDAGKGEFVDMDFVSFYVRTQPNAFESIGPIYSDASAVPGYPEEKDIFQQYIWSMVSESTTAVGLDLWMKQRGEDYTRVPLEMEWRPASVLNNQAGIHMDVDGKSTVDGLYCAGVSIGGGWRHAATGAFVFGARAGRNAAEYAKRVQDKKINDEQVKREKAGILESLNTGPEDGYSWIELEDKARQIATDYGPPLSNDAKLERGLVHLERIETKYLPKIYARNPREMMRVSEVNSIFFIAKSFLKAALFRKESRTCDRLSIFYKTDYPHQDDKNWLKHTVIRNIRGELRLSTKAVNRLT